MLYNVITKLTVSTSRFTWTVSRDIGDLIVVLTSISAVSPPLVSSRIY